MTTLRTAALPFVALLAALAIPCAASAQDGGVMSGGITYTIQAIEGRSATELNTTAIPIRKSECESNITIELRLRNVPMSGATVLDFWRGQNCNDASNRSSTTTTNCTNIAPAAGEVEISGRSDFTLTIPITDLVSCTGVATEYLYVLATNMVGSTADVGNNYAAFSIAFDTSAPTAVTGIEGGDGENTLSISWDNEAEDIQENKIFAEKAACDSSSLMNGDVNPTASFTRTIAGTATSYEVSAADLGLAVGESAVIGVQPLDRARNPGPLAVVCVTRIETMGFCDAYGECPDDCAVVAPGAGGITLTIALVGIAALALVVVRRRRK